MEDGGQLLQYLRVPRTNSIFDPRTEHGESARRETGQGAQLVADAGDSTVCARACRGRGALVQGALPGGAALPSGERPLPRALQGGSAALPDQDRLGLPGRISCTGDAASVPAGE